MRRLPLLLVLVMAATRAACAPAAAGEAEPAVPSFVEETASAGIDGVYAGEWEYMVGGGVATFDCNGDGFDDMLLPGGASPARFYRNVSRPGGSLRFEVQESGLELDRVTGAYPLDVDGDLRPDLVLLRVGENVLENLQLDLQLEQEAVEALREAITHCREVEDYASRKLFEDMIASEEEHLDWVETQLEAISQIGIELYLSQQLHEDD